MCRHTNIWGKVGRASKGEFILLEFLLWKCITVILHNKEAKHFEIGEGKIW